ncbi:hypothetical protein OUY22_07290 [Nonomuraea sp. MCN248]|uniref:Secreted protein n=1 Tax=Nonomuraea corallina TaxID=2989783 RepID=A0ABT4S8G6_9ACTN|nr:hypothetical protein [Nonomuraea corallina]MDA0633221.1 hypothetical protein [Nonomuraea corallina]
MSRRYRRFASLAVVPALALATTGCVEVNTSIDRAQACLEAPKIVADLTGQLTQLANDPQAMEKALDDTAAKLNDLADQAANTTIKEASDNLANTLADINVKDVNDAVDAAQKVSSETAAYVQRITEACTGG